MRRSPVSGWAELLAKHGTIPLARALEPAIRYAREGFPVALALALRLGAGRLPGAVVRREGAEIVLVPNACSVWASSDPVRVN